jgi:hypothetical protein
MRPITVIAAPACVSADRASSKRLMSLCPPQKAWIGGHSRAKNAAAAYSTLEFGYGRNRISAVSCF